MFDKIRDWWGRQPVIVRDVTERAGKSFFQGFSAGSLIFTAIEHGAIRLTDIEWLDGLNMGGGMAIFSVVTSALSWKRSNNGTASLSKGVVAADVPPKA